MLSTRTAIGTTHDFPANLGQCIKIDGLQIAVFHLPATPQKWFAVQNLNPQNQRMVLSRGLVGEEDGIPYIACPLHKDKYALTDGACLTDSTLSITTYPIIIDGEQVAIEISNT